MNKHSALIALAVVLAVAVISFWLLRRDSNEQDFATVTRGSMDVTIQTVGTLQATGAVAVRSDVTGVIKQLGVDAGDLVAQGDIVAVLERAPFDDAVSAAEERVTEAEYGLQFAEQHAAENDDDSSLKAATLEAAQRVQLARDALQGARDALSTTVILAPATGTVIEIQLRAGEAIASGQSLARIATTEDLQLIADIDELDLPNVSIGAVVRFRLDSFPAVEIKGIVRATAPQARQQGGATVFDTTVEFVAPGDLDVRPGMNADVTIVTAERANVLLIPERALTTVGERVFVEVRVDDGLVEREITLGNRGNGQVEVVDGLREGDRVLLR